MMNEGSTGIRNAAIVATRQGDRVVWHTLRREPLKCGRGERLRRHGAHDLDRVQSLEGLVRRFGDAEIVYDPTGAFERARRLVSAACAARKQLGARLVSLHVLENGRSIYARARIEADIDHVAPVVGAAFARALSGVDFQIMVKVGVASPPARALPLEQIGARRDQVMAAAQRVSAAIAIAGAAIYGLAPVAANAGEPVASGDCTATPPTARTTQPVRSVRAIYSPNGALLALHLADADRGGSQDTAHRALDAVRGLTPEQLDRAVRGASVATDGLRLKVRRQRSVDGVAYAVDVTSDADAAAATPLGAVAAGGAVFVPVKDSAPAPAPVPAPHTDVALIAAPMRAFDYAEVSAGALVRGDQSGAIAQGEVQFKTAPEWAVGVQGALGTLDGDLAGGAQAVLQHTVTVNGMQADVGAFASGVQSTAPSGEDFGIARLGAGVAATIRDVQLIVRGGYASGNGDLDADGGFVRAEGVWFATPDVGIGAFVETDPTTGAGAGVGASFKPFTGTLANMMIDADAAWHEDGEESFRLGLRWLLGRKEGSSLKDQRARKGITPDLMDDLRRLPDELERNNGLQSKQTQPYCGDAANPCPTT